MRSRGSNLTQDRSIPMTDHVISPLRQRMIEDMTVRKFTAKTQNDYIRVVKNFTIFLADRLTPLPMRICVGFNCT